MTSIYFVDQKDESFYTVSWACNNAGTSFAVAGGINGIIRVIDAGSEKIDKVFVTRVSALRFSTMILS